jgi:hypothetical protein
MVCCRQRLSFTWDAGGHKVGFGLALWSTPNLFWRGPRERDRVVTERELFFACFLWGIALLRVRVLLAGP